MREVELRDVWLSVSDVALPLAELRDEYLKFQGFQADLGRFGQLETAYANLNIVEQTLFEYIEQKSPLFGKKPNREVLMIANAAIQNSRILAEIARGELNLMRQVGSNAPNQ